MFLVTESSPRGLVRGRLLYAIDHEHFKRRVAASSFNPSWWFKAVEIEMASVSAAEVRSSRLIEPSFTAELFGLTDATSNAGAVVVWQKRRV